MTWLNNLKEYIESNKTGKCPRCGSDNVKVDVLRMGRGSYTFTCAQCGSFAHYDMSTNQFDIRQD